MVSSGAMLGFVAVAGIVLGFVIRERQTGGAVAGDGEHRESVSVAGR